MGAAAESFKLGEGNPIVVYVILGLIILAGIVTLALYLYKNVYLKKRQENYEWARFHHVCHRRKLTTAEIEFLADIVRKYRLKRPVYLVRFLETFNRYIFREVEDSRGKETNKRERFKAFIFNLRKKLGFSNFSRLEELSSTREVASGQRIRASVNIANMDKGFSSKIHDVDEDGLRITCPEHFLEEEPVREGQSVKFHAIHREDAEYLFSTSIFKVIPGPPGYLYLNHSRSFTRSQRRKYTRMAGQFKLRYFLLNKLQKKEFMERRTATVTGDTIWTDAIIENLSAGGFVFNTSAEFDEDTLMGIVISLTEDGPVLKDIVGRISRALGEEENAERKLIVQFVKIPEKTREKITRFIFESKNTKKSKKKPAKKKASNKQPAK